MKQSICGPWMRYTFNNTDRGVECGYRRRSKTPCYNITLRARALATSAQCVFATANSFMSLCIVGCRMTATNPILLRPLTLPLDLYRMVIEKRRINLNSGSAQEREIYVPLLG